MSNIIRRTAQRASVRYNRKWLDGDRYYSHTVGNTSFWTPDPREAARYESEDEARKSEGMMIGCEIVDIASESIHANNRSER